MWWRQSQKEFKVNAGAANKRKFKRLVTQGVEPGIIAYSGDEPIGWCAVRPREDYMRFETSRILAPVDDRPVWSITCLFVDRKHRHQGVATALLKAAVAHVRRNRGRIIEGYPTETSTRQPDAWVWTGIASAYVDSGFREVARRSKTRPIMRYFLAK
jgi:GNAT superfamily N-acetyltransferase